MLAASGLLLVTAMVFADMLLRLPRVIRAVLLVNLVVAMVWSVRRRLLPVTRFKPGLSDVALRVERWLDRRGGEPAGPIASGIDLPIDDPEPLTRRLSRLVAEKAAGRFTRTPWGLLRWAPPARSLAFAVAVAAGLSVLFNAQPTLAVTGLTRLFAPWTDTPWPKRTQIADTTPADAHPADTGLPVRAVLLKTNRQPGETSITVTYRVVDGRGEAGPSTQAVLTPQPAAASFTPGAGELFERLVEPAAWQGVEGDERWLEYTLSSEDDITAKRRVKIVEPPALVGRATAIVPPPYARGIRAGFAAGVVNAPAPAPGETIEIGPVLPGSSLTIDLAYNKPVTPRPQNDPAPVFAAQIEPDGETIRVTADPAETGRVVLHAADRFGLKTRRPATLQINVTPDTPPEATMLRPEADDVVLPTAIVPLVGEGRDDIGLTGLRLERLIARPDPASQSGEPVVDPGAEPIVISSITPGLDRSADLEASLTLADLGVRPGDEVWVRAVATDNFDLGGKTHEPVFSATRRLRVIAPARFVEMLQSELEGVRRTAIRLDRQQAGLMEQARGASRAREQGEDDAGAEQLEQIAQRQTGLSQRLRAQSAMLERLTERTEQNGLADQAIRDLLDQAERTTDRAARASEQAAERLAEQAREPDADPEPAEQSQENVRDELARLIDQLDRGQDGWLVRRNIEQLLSEERALRGRTEEIAGQTVGRSLAELEPDERTELERIAQRQRELAQRARDAIDQLGERADEVREEDPTQAAAMDEAAENAMRERLAELMREAAEQIGQNQTASGGQMQERSIEAMEEMLEQLENAQRHRDEALRRQLASIIQTIESLIRQQTAAIGALDGDAAEASRLAERAHTNTLAAEADTRVGFPELARVADLLGRAAAAQAGAITSLRGLVPAIDEARAHETESLARLNEALEEARQQDEDAEQREQQRKRREMREAYQDALAEQVSLRDEAGVFVGAEMTRRLRAELRGVGQRQEALRVVIEAIPEAHEADDVGVLSLYHGRIDLLLTDAVRSMGRGSSDAGVLASQGSAIALLRSIVDTLTPQPSKPSDEFEEGQGGGGGGGGGGEDRPSIGNVEQLRLLRNLQAIVLDQTRAGETGGLADLQRELAEQTRGLIEQMSQPPNPGGPRPGTEGEGGE